MNIFISKTYSNYGIKKTIFENFKLDLDEKKITSIVAPFNSGKSTLLKVLAGIEQADEKINSIQNNFFITCKPMSLPWLNLKETLLFVNKNLDDKKLNEISKIVGLDGYETHYPHNKSLGFRFRITLAAAVAKNANLILLDEPFQDMENLTKNELYQLLVDLNNTYYIGFVLGTSNLNEAILLSDEIILLKNIPHKTYDKFVIHHSSQIIEERIKSDVIISTNQKIINIINQDELSQSINYIL